MHYHYQAFGLPLVSCLPCPQLLPTTQSPAIQIKMGSVPSCLSNIRQQGSRYQATDHELLLKIDQVATYWVQSGQTITINRAPQAEDNAIHPYLWGSAIGALLFQRGFLVLHGSAVVIKGEAVLFIGESGAGKSTTASALSQRGYSLASDDLCAIKITSQQVLLQPSFPQVKLWKDACHQLSLAHSTLGKASQKPIRRPIYATPDKYAISIPDTFWRSPLPIKRIYWLTPEENIDCALLLVKGAEKLQVLKQQTYRQKIVHGMGYSKRHLQQCLQLAAQVPLMQVTRPRNADLLNKLIDLIEADATV